MLEKMEKLIIKYSTYPEQILKAEAKLLDGRINNGEKYLQSNETESGFELFRNLLRHRAAVYFCFSKYETLFNKEN